MQDTELLDELDKLLSGELKCQSSHRKNDGRVIPCTVEVVARKYARCDNRSFFICQASYEANLNHMKNDGSALWFLPSSRH